MTSRTPSFKTLKKSIRRPPSRDEVVQLYAESLAQGDRATAIVLGTIVEGGLEEVILSRLITLSNTDYAMLFEGDAPIGSFSSKIKLGFALQIYGAKTRADLNRIREIRNAFAHARKPISFDTPEIAHVCKLLSFHDRVPDSGDVPAPDTSKPKIKFIVNCVQLRTEFASEGSRERAAMLKPRPHMV